MSRPLVILLSILFVSLLAYFWNEASQPTSSPTLEPPAEISEKPLSPLQYVGGKTCTTCHAHESQRWEKSHHDLAMQEANEATVLGDFNNTTLTLISANPNVIALSIPSKIACNLVLPVIKLN